MHDHLLLLLLTFPLLAQSYLRDSPSVAEMAEMRAKEAENNAEVALFKAAMPSKSSLQSS